ncbi:MOP flippase family protein [uncultured Bacteroides sp.]|uniref:MOP flippase family protein n=1 Tax=uncultured Bacteroides sp. TaxID=162156 RepID=UPI00260BDAA8|nr:MOP flippase family protein [uncultured Bacteroides sp.]
MSLSSVAIKGIAWSSISTMVRSIVSLLQVSILTRYLDKVEFGIVAICTLFIGFSQIFLDLGFSVGIIHKQNITSWQYSSLFWLNIFSGILITGGLCLFAPIVAKVYDEPSLIKILSLLSLTILFSSIGNQHRTVQQKQMRFKYISVIEIVASLMTLVVAILLVTNGYGIYSLVYSTLFNVLLSNLLFFCIGMSKDRNISFHFDLKDTYPFLKIGVFSVGTQVFDYLSREIDMILISITLGKESLGGYSLCKKIVMSVYSAVTPILTKVLAPAFAHIQNDINHVRKIYYDVVESIAIVNFPIYFLISIFSYGIIRFLYGNSYTDCAIVLSLLAIYYGFLSTGSPVGSLQTALGRTDTGFYWTILRILFNAFAIYVGSHFNIEGIIISLFLITLCTKPISWRITVKPLIKGHFMEYIMKSIIPLIIITVYSVPFYLVLGGISSIVGMLVCSIGYILVYCFIIHKLMDNSYCVNTVRLLVIKMYGRFYCK